MGPIAARLRAWWRRNKATAVGLAAAVAVTTGAVLVLVAGVARTASAPDRYVDALPFRFDVDIEQLSGTPRVDELVALPSVDAVEMATFTFTAGFSRSTGGPVDGIAFVGEPTPLGSPGVADGRLPADPFEFVATSSYVDQLGGGVGEAFTFAVIPAELAAERGFDVDPAAVPTMAATLVGVLDGGADELAEGYPVALFPRTLLDEVDVGTASSPGLAQLVPGATLDDLRADLDTLPGSSTFQVRPAELVPGELRTAISTQAGAVGVVAALSALAAVAVLAQLLGRQFRLDADERRFLAAVGCTRAQAALDPLARVAAVAAVGTIGGALLAVAASGAFPIGLARGIEPDPGLRPDPLVHGLGAVVLVLAVVGATALLRPGGTEVRVPPPARPTLAARLAATVPDPRLATALRLSFGPGVAGAARASTLAGLAAVVALVAGALTFGANLGRLVDEPRRWGDAYDLAVDSEGGQSLRAGVVDTLLADDDVVAASLYGSTAVSVGSRPLTLVGIEPLRGALLPEVIEGRLPQGDDEVALGRVAARVHGAEVGTVLAATAPSGPVSLRVVGIAVTPGIDDADGAGRSGVVTGDGFAALAPDDAMTAVVFDLTPAARADLPAAVAHFEELVGGVGRFDLPTYVTNLDRIRGAPFLVAAVAGALAVLSLGHLVITAVRRGRRDLAVLRTMGATGRWIGGVVRGQAAAVTTVVAAVAVPVGIVAGRALYRPYAAGVGARDDAAIPLAWLGLLVAGLLVLAVLAAAVPARRARRASPAWLLTRS